MAAAYILFVRKCSRIHLLNNIVIFFNKNVGGCFEDKKIIIKDVDGEAPIMP